MRHRSSLEQRRQEPSRRTAESRHTRARLARRARARREGEGEGVEREEEEGARAALGVREAVEAVGKRRVRVSERGERGEAVAAAAEERDAQTDEDRFGGRWSRHPTPTGPADQPRTLSFSCCWRAFVRARRTPRFPRRSSLALAAWLRGCVRCEHARCWLPLSLSLALPVRMSAPRTCRATS